MAARDSMVYIVALLRQYGQAATDDVFNGTTYWTDDQLQSIADSNGVRGYVKLKRVDPDNLIYRLVMPKSLRPEDNLRIFTIGDTEVTTGFTYNTDTQELTFDEALTEDLYRAYGLVINLYDALAQLWGQKAEQRFNYIDWKAQNNKMNMEQEYKHCLDRQSYYRARRVRAFRKDGRGEWYI